MTAYDSAGNTSGQSNQTTATTLPATNAGTSEFSAVADTFVNGNSPSVNYGSSATVETDGSPSKIIYLRFDVRNLSGSVKSAKLRLDCVNQSIAGGNIRKISNNSWNEQSITYQSKPALDGTILDTLGRVYVGDLVELDVTAAMAGNGIYSFAIQSANSDGVDYRSRESQVNPPMLIVTSDETASANTPPRIDSGPVADATEITAGQTAKLSVTASDSDGDVLTYNWSVPSGQGNIEGSGNSVVYAPPAVSQTETFTVTVKITDGKGGTVSGSVAITVNPSENPSDNSGSHTFSPVADTFVDANRPSNNYGSSAAIEVDGTPDKIVYIRFNVTNLTGTVASAKLVLDCTNKSIFGGDINLISNNSWGEKSVTYKTKPAIDGPVLDTVNRVAVGDTVEFDVKAAITGNGSYSFAIESDNPDGVDYRSRESQINPPQLIIETR